MTRCSDSEVFPAEADGSAFTEIVTIAVSGRNVSELQTN